MSGADAFRILADVLPEPILLVDGSGQVTYANRAAMAFFGRSQDLIGMSLERLADGDEEAARALVRASSRSGSLVPGSVRFKTAGGGSVSCRCEGAVLQPRDENTPAIVLLRIATRDAAAHQFTALNERIHELTREVGRRRIAEAALREQTNRLRVTLGSIGDAVIATDAAGNVTLMNAVAQSLTGWRIEQALGRPLAEVFVIVNEFTRALVENPVARVLREGGVVGLANHTLLIARDGSERPIDDSGAPIEDDGGRLLGVVLVFHDITERHQMERELRQKTMQLEEADRRKDDFLAMLGHELRNPLAPLTTGVHLLQKSPDSRERVVAIAEMMSRQLGHVTRLVDDLLDVARLTRGSIELRKAPVRLRAMLDQAVEVSRPLIDSRRQSLAVRDGSDLMVQGDSARLVQVFSNLLNNAAKYTPPGGEIWLETRVDAQAVLITVGDSGEGIDPALLPHVFDLFTQGARGLDRSQGGLGIGLTVVRAIVGMHGGTVEARSAGVGLGSTFEVRLPAAAAAGGPLPGSEAAFGSTTAGLGRRVLVVDDNQDAAESMAAVVESWGYQVQTAHSAAAALECYEVWSPDILLLDIGLPDMDGYALARRFRQSLEGQPALLIAITGYGHAADRKAGMEAGFHHYLTKPADLGQLEEIMRAFQPARVKSL